ncbi:SURF1 family protein [Sphingomonas prati]|uniref:SURF1-like protein n=1 Tax=Sphingomonas prati TaxID=1843237 RepID=A0A7W9BSK2_9SPHN|nr:surfeit locus 1 family protein [Sphingomonas prati]GGE78002.1 SURF1-like protein [Sphingomonas prati]
MTDGAAGAPDTGARPPRSRLTLVILTIVTALLVAGLFGLGTWQVNRLAWKRDLIARVNARVHAPPVPAPGPTAWAGLDTENASYRNIRLTGRYRNDRSVRTQAATVLGAGSWLVTPLVTDAGFTVLVNRGFVPPSWQDRTPPSGPVTVTGLLRITEPGGGFLRRNDPAAGRWYSRDVAAIATAQRLGPAAPYFVDAAADPAAPTRPPVGGLTIISFPNNHLSYAITWYALALMLIGGWVLVLRYERRLRR